MRTAGQEISNIDFRFTVRHPFNAFDHTGGPNELSSIDPVLYLKNYFEMVLHLPTVFLPASDFNQSFATFLSSSGTYVWGTSG